MQWLMPLVAGWWLCNVVATILSKTVMLDGASASIVRDQEVLPLAFRDLRWLDLTLLQHLVAAVGASAWVALVRGDRVFPAMNKTTHRHIVVASVGNALGNLATNASFAAVSSSMTQVVKSCEPLFTLVLTLLFYREGAAFGSATLASVLAMVAGVCVYLYSEASFNLWGLGAAVVANIAFPLRNIYLKKAETAVEEPMRRLAVASVMSVSMLCPLAGIKLVVSGAWPAVPPGEGLTSAVFHFLYNAASVGVLQRCSPVTHAILNLCKRVFVIVASLAFFGTHGSNCLVGLLLFFIGLAAFHFDQRVRRTSAWPPLPVPKWPVLLSLAAAAACTVGLLRDADSYAGVFKSGGGGEHLTPTTFTTAWVYERPVPVGVVDNIAALHGRNPGSSVVVYCGNSQCVSAIRALGQPAVVALFLEAGDLVRDTPLDGWLRRHPIHKVLMGRAFEDHLHEAVKLALLWHHGGVFFDPSVRLSDFSPPPLAGAWVAVAPGPTSHDAGTALLGLSHFPPYHDFVGKLASTFATQYEQEVSLKDGASAGHFDFRRSVQAAYEDACIPTAWPRCPTGVQMRLDRLALPSSSGRGSFGTLAYERYIKGTRGANLGDEIQGYAGVHFLPVVDHFVEREHLGMSADVGPVQVFFNAWWAGESFNWPPPDNIDPILLSVHFRKEVEGKVLKHADYLSQRGPVGCRDTSTLEFLTRNDIQAFFSGCLTLSIKNPHVEAAGSGSVYLVDLKPEYEALLPEEIRRNAVRSEHYYVSSQKRNNYQLYRAAYDKLEMYSAARVVVTQRIHCALPCVAMDTPVIFIDSPNIPGGGGSPTAQSGRVQGLSGLFHTLDTRGKSEEELKGWLRDFAWAGPPPNPGVALRMRLRATSWNVIRQREALYDSARKFGLLPLSAPAPASDDRLLFHVFIPRTPGQRSTVRGLHWSTWRTIESVLHHHPLAEVVVHSDAATQSQFQVLTEAGYTIRVQRLNAGTGPGRHTATAEADLDRLKMEILLEAGGVYLDSSVILTKPVERSPRNALVGSEGVGGVGLPFMRFERKGHPFLKAALRYCHRLRNGFNCDRSVLASWKGWKDGPEAGAASLSLIPRETSTLHFSRARLHQCLAGGAAHGASEAEGDRGAFLAQVEGIQGESGPLEPGSVCKHLFNAFCVLCNEIY